ncbi:dipeptide ABC transporter ATP-binding protein [Microbacterium foliorum]|uniref:dipeptide ABC transporter ATP-binding protein n=1 Tax=Microbacterium foliorum TaxID=104336 RepID=UPI001D8591D1|nr:ABC transporter ATP-binding protein [Microbacterium foliorum]CAH0170151.1 Glutathione import ATP-binding protein GsiA [Microbacterium foliorum]CAH0193564.1 Glutathione import ATP-binding protein GsiA [Microbacterium foliorum]
MTTTPSATASSTQAPDAADVILDVRDLTIAYEVNGRSVTAVENVSFSIRRGETFGLAGESGSGKSTIANAILKLLGGNGRIVSGSIRCGDVEIESLTGEELRAFRWNRVSMVFQSAMNSLNPVMTVGDQIFDVFTTHRSMSRAEARDRARQLLELVGIDPDRMTSYPHQLSGGMRQRAVIAIALALEPDLLIMDEPTTALDVVVQQEIINEIKELQARLGFAILFITHDLSLMVEISQRLGIMRHGVLLEVGDSAEVYARPTHEYTRKLIDAFPPVTRDPSAPAPASAAVVVDGASPDADADAPGEVVVSFRDVTKDFTGGSMFARRSTRAVDGASFDLHAGEIMALVGESGSGKSTIARILARLEQPSAGRLVVEGIDVLRDEPRRASRRYRNTVQMVFQDPFGSLNPTKRIRHFLERPLAIYSDLSAAQRRQEAVALMHSVELDPALLDRHPHELSGGQRQRVAIARALAVNPKVILADEPTSMLDVSVRMGVLQLLKRLRDERGISILYITHDLASARFVADTTIVMLRGALVEGGASAEVMDAPQHPYTRLLVSAAPDPLRRTPFDREERARVRALIHTITEGRSPAQDRPAHRFVSSTHWYSQDGLD